MFSRLVSDSCRGRYYYFGTGVLYLVNTLVDQAGSKNTFGLVSTEQGRLRNLSKKGLLWHEYEAYTQKSACPGSRSRRSDTQPYFLRISSLINALTSDIPIRIIINENGIAPMIMAD